MADFDFTLSGVGDASSASKAEEVLTFNGLLQIYVPPNRFILSKHIDIHPAVCTCVHVVPQNFENTAVYTLEYLGSQH